MSDQSYPRHRRDPSHLQHEAEHTRPRKSGSILLYLVVLFAAALLLLLLAYFQQQRQQAETNSDALRQSASAAETLRLMQEENQTLRAQLEELEDQLSALERQAEELKGQNAELDSARRAQNLQLEQLFDQVDAMQWFWQIDDYYVRDYRIVARQLVEQFEATGLKDSLPTENTTGTNRFSPAARYQEICDDLY